MEMFGTKNYTQLMFYMVQTHQQSCRTVSDLRRHKSLDNLYETATVITNLVQQ